jgi:carboxymethylenebutenolidase
VATEYYARLGDLSKMTDIQQIFSNVISREPDATLMSDMDSTADWAAGHSGNGKLGVLGFCRGGRAVWFYAAHSSRLKAAVAFYGPVKSPVSSIQPKTAIDLAREIKCPLLGLYGGQDASISLTDVGTAERLAKDSGKAVEIVVYQDAGHGFHADYRPSYNAKDAQDAWSHALAWLHQFVA